MPSKALNLHVMEGGKMAGTKTATLQRTTVVCGFCRGGGRDPFEIMSALSTCCVCGGTGTISIETPYTRCAFCKGTGVYPHSRQTCIACGGVGMSPVQKPNRTCPHCLGTGVGGKRLVGFYCLTCHGTGVVKEDG